MSDYERLRVIYSFHCLLKLCHPQVDEYSKAFIKKPEMLNITKMIKIVQFMIKELCEPRQDFKFEKEDKSNWIVEVIVGFTKLFMPIIDTNSVYPEYVIVKPDELVVKEKYEDHGKTLYHLITFCDYMSMTLTYNEHHEYEIINFKSEEEPVLMMNELFLSCFNKN